MVINNRKYFAFFYYAANGQNVTSYCFHTFWGWAHGTGVNPSDWSCAIATRADGQNITKSHTSRDERLLQYNNFFLFLAIRVNIFILKIKKKRIHETKLYEKNEEYITRINKKQSLWKASHYDFMNGLKISDVFL